MELSLSSSEGVRDSGVVDGEGEEGGEAAAGGAGERLRGATTVGTMTSFGKRSERVRQDGGENSTAEYRVASRLL